MPAPALRSTITWDSKLATVAGNGAARIEKAFGYRTVGDLLQHYPRRWVDKGSLSDLGAIEPDEHITVIAEVVRSKLHSYTDRRRGGTAYRLEVVVATEDHQLSVTYFDKKKHIAEWREQTIRPGSTGLFAGKVGTFRGQLQLTNPQNQMFGSSGDESTMTDEAATHWDSIPQLITIYPATSTVQSWQISEAIALALDLVGEVPELLPESVRTEHDFVSARQALRWLHRPDSWAQKEAAARRLRFDEAFVTQAVLAQRRAALVAQAAEPRAGRDGGLLDRFDDRLPFTLTDGQQEVSRAVLGDLAAGHPMHRLLQGEVGSGKTVVALRAMLRVVDSGGQAALLAPTEVLAQQHHRSITAMLGDLAAGGMLGGAADGTQVALLTGSLGRRRPARGDARRRVGGGRHRDRHARPAGGQGAVRRPRLRGGRRAAPLRGRAARGPHGQERRLPAARAGDDRDPDPADGRDDRLRRPGDLDAVRAAGRTRPDPDQRRARSSDHPGWLDRGFARIREEVAAGHQVYVVCPRIGGSDDGTAAAGRQRRLPPDGRPSRRSRRCSPRARSTGCASRCCTAGWRPSARTR